MSLKTLSLIKTFISNFMKSATELSRVLYSRFEATFSSSRAQFTLTLGAVLLLIIFKGNQPNIVGSVVRHYVEETSASIIPAESPAPVTDINTLMGATIASTGQGSGQGGSGQDHADHSETPYTFREDSVQAVTAISMDYLDDYKSNKINEYTVQPGDALSFIASDFGITPESVLWANKLSSPDSIKPGQVLRIPPVSGVIHKVQKGDTLSSIASKYNADSSKVLAFNDLQENEALALGAELVIPDGIVSIVRPAIVVPKNTVPAAYRSSITNVAKRFANLPDLGDYFKIPTTGFDWGIVHGRNGVDVANPCGTPVHAAANGNVTTALGSGWNGGFGRYVKIVHSNGTETLYAHLSKLLVTPGTEVVKGQEIGLMGTTGHSTGCHLHFEVHGARNPLAKY